MPDHNTIVQQKEPALFKAIRESQLIRDNIPTFYVSADGRCCTHRLGNIDIPVWCKSAEDGFKLMQIIDSLQRHNPLNSRRRINKRGIESMKVETESIESEKSAVLAGRLDRFVRPPVMRALS